MGGNNGGPEQKGVGNGPVAHNVLSRSQPPPMNARPSTEPSALSCCIEGASMQRAPEMAGAKPPCSPCRVHCMAHGTMHQCPFCCLPIRGQRPIGSSWALQLRIVILQVPPPEQIVARQAFAKDTADERVPAAFLGREATASETAIQKGVMGLAQRQVRVTKMKDPHLNTRQRHCSPRSNSTVSAMPAGPKSDTQTAPGVSSAHVHVQPFTQQWHHTSTRRTAHLILLCIGIWNGDCKRIGRWL